MTFGVDRLVGILRETDPGPSSEVVDLHQWRVFTEREWQVAKIAATARDEQKRKFQSSRYWNEHSHFTGLLGEIHYGVLSGEPVDLRLLVEGDGGRDFRDVDVKATHYSPPFLKESTNPKNGWSSFYVLVGLDLAGRRARYCGYITGDDLRKAPTRDFGYGPRHFLAEGSLVQNRLPRAILPAGKEAHEDGDPA